MDWNRMSTRQKNAAREIRATYGVTVSQAAKFLDEAMACQRGEISIAALAEATGWDLEIEEEEESADDTAGLAALRAECAELMADIAEAAAALPEPAGGQMSTRQAAAALGVSVRTVQRWAAVGRVSAVKAGGRWTITITL